MHGVSCSKPMLCATTLHNMAILTRKASIKSYACTILCVTPRTYACTLLSGGRLQPNDACRVTILYTNENAHHFIFLGAAVLAVRDSVSVVLGMYPNTALLAFVDSG